MPDNEIITIADAVVTELTAATLSQAFVPVRAYLPRYKLPDMSSLHVTVVPVGKTIAPADRSSTLDDFRIGIAVQKKITVEQNVPSATELDALLLLEEEIADFFKLRRLTAAPSARWVATEIVPIYDPKHLEELGQFTGLIVLTFRVFR